MLRLISYFIFLPLLFCSCSRTKADLIAPLPDQHFAQPLTVPAKTLYVLSERPYLMSIIDLNSWQILRQVPLPSSYVERTFTRNSDGTLWIGYTGNGFSDDRVQIFQPDGNLKRTFYPCLNPGSGIHFLEQHALLVCDELGFYASIQRIDLPSLQIKPTITLTVDFYGFLATGSGGDSDNIFVMSIGGGPRETSYTDVFVLNPTDGQTKGHLPVFEDTRLSDAIVTQNKYYLLNSASWRDQSQQPADAIVIDRSMPLTYSTISLATRAPTWGVVIGDDLYTYHDPSWNQANSKPERAIARTSLKTGEGQLWPLSDYFRVGDMLVVDGKILLAGNGGVWELNQTTGEVTKRVELGWPTLMVASK